MGRLCGWILVICLVAYVLQLAVAAVVILFFIGIIVGLYRRPKETIGGLTLLTILGLMSKYPAVGFGLIALFGCWAIFLAIIKSDPADPTDPPPDEEAT
jgi:hypothetical protein